MNDHLGKVFKILYFPIKSENSQLHTNGYPFYDSKMQNFENWKPNGHSFFHYVIQNF